MINLKYLVKKKGVKRRQARVRRARKLQSFRLSQYQDELKQFYLKPLISMLNKQTMLATLMDKVSVKACTDKIRLGEARIKLNYGGTS